MLYELSHISHTIDNKPILNNLNLSILSGDCINISGDSGCGKSLLFSIMSGVFIPNNGDVLINGQSIKQMHYQQLIHFRKQLGVIFQIPALISNLTLIENLFLPLNQHHPELNNAQKLSKIMLLIDEFELNQYLHFPIAQLPSGLAMLAAITRALLNQPKCLIWDAPLYEVDIQWNKLIEIKLQQLKTNGSTIILFTKYKNTINDLADRNFILSHGELRNYSAVQY